MTKFSAAILLLALSGSPMVLAQSATENGPAVSATGVPPAPVGHLQPTARTIAPDTYNDAQNKQAKELAKQDAILDRKIKGICRGC